MPTFGDEMKTLNTILLAILCLCSGCKQPKANAALKRRADSLDSVKKAKAHDRLMQSAQDSTLYVPRSKAGAAIVKPRRNYGPCPVAIKKCSLIADVHGGKAIIAMLKNTSSKRIDAVKLSWTVYNQAGKAIGSAGGMAKKALVGGRSASYSWGINAPSGTRGKASVLYIHFNDGSIWQ